MRTKVERSKRVIKDAIDKYYPKLAVACSFGKDSVVVVHLAREIMPDIPIFTVMTKYKPKATFEYKDMVIKKWKLNIKEYMSEKDVPFGLWKTDPDQCCRILKVEPTKEAVKDLDCWICGLRNTEGRTRVDFREIEVRNDLVKVNPILYWTEADIWRYIALNQIPVHPWYGEDYRSLGCQPCTIPGTELERGGRWQNTSKCGGECGIHSLPLK